MTGGERVLVVDDEPLVLDTLCEMLSVEGYEVQGASSADAALDLGREGKFDILLTDLMMPDKDGLELVREFRELSPDTAAIIITGYGSAESAQRAIQEGVYYFVAKPVGQADLAGRVASALQRRACCQQAAVVDGSQGGASAEDTGGDEFRLAENDCSSESELTAEKKREILSPQGLASHPASNGAGSLSRRLPHYLRLAGRQVMALLLRSRAH